MDFKKKTYIAAIMAVCTSMMAQNTDTNGPSRLSLDFEAGRQKDSVGLAGKYADNIGFYGSVAALDKFGPMTDMDWMVKGENDGYAAVSDWNDTGRSVIQRSFLDAGRELVADSPGVEAWVDSKGWKSTFAWFLGGTVGNTPEEHLRPVSTSITASTIAWVQARLAALGENEAFLIAPHMLDSRPYIYQSSVLRDSKGRPIIVENIRLRYVVPDSGRVEATIVVPLTDSWLFQSGASFNPLRVGGDGSGSGASFGFSKVFSVEQSFSVGYAFDERGRGSFRLALNRRF